MRPRHLAPLLLAALIVLGACTRTPPLLHVTSDNVRMTAPDSFLVRYVTSKGPFDVMYHRDWAPIGNDRVYYLTRAKFYDGTRFFRVVDKFVAQWGMSGDTAVGAAWRPLRIADDPVKASNVRGTVTFASGGKNTRTTQLYINFRDNTRLDTASSGPYPPIGKVVKGLTEVVDSLYSGYGEGAPRGKGPEQGRIAREGNAYLAKEFPKLDSIVTARIIKEWKR
jgi:peptidyl-prolyl cis-trans isomerase A (cyclophilin A)